MKHKLKKYAILFWSDGNSGRPFNRSSSWVLIKYNKLIPKKQLAYYKTTYTFASDAVIIYRSEKHKKDIWIKKIPYRNGKKYIYARWKSDRYEKPFRAYFSSEDGDIKFKATSNAEAILYAIINMQE